MKKLLLILLPLLFISCDFPNSKEQRTVKVVFTNWNSFDIYFSTDDMEKAYKIYAEGEFIVTGNYFGEHYVYASLEKPTSKDEMQKMRIYVPSNAVVKPYAIRYYPDDNKFKIR